MTSIGELRWAQQSTMDGDPQLYTDDPRWKEWTVTLVHPDGRRDIVESTGVMVPYPRFNPLAAWWLDCGECHWEILDAHGRQFWTACTTHDLQDTLPPMAETPGYPGPGGFALMRDLD